MGREAVVAADLLHDAQAQTGRVGRGVVLAEPLKKPGRVAGDGRAGIGDYQLLGREGDGQLATAHVVLHGVLQQVVQQRVGQAGVHPQHHGRAGEVEAVAQLAGLKQRLQLRHFFGQQLVEAHGGGLGKLPVLDAAEQAQRLVQAREAQRGAVQAGHERGGGGVVGQGGHL